MAVLNGMVLREEKGSALTIPEHDGNFRILAEAIIAAGAGRTIIGTMATEDGTGFYFVMSSGDPIGPINLPQPEAPEPTDAFDEAPLDGLQYARQNAEWSEVIGQVEEAPEDGKRYVRRNEDWVEITIGEAPKDGTPYVRQDGTWIAPVSGGSGSTPTDSFRIRGTWTSNMSMEAFDVVEHNDMLWMCRASYGTTAPAPSFGASGYWKAISFPSTFNPEGVTDQLLHQWASATKTGRQDIWTILNAFEAVNVAQSNKITALENRLAAAGIA